MDHKNPWWGDLYMEIFEEMPYPLILLDKELSFCWSNRAADTLFFGEPLEAAVKRVIFEHGASTLSDKMNQKVTIRLMSGELLRTNEYLLSPVFKRGKLVGCTMTQAPPESNAQLVVSKKMDNMIATFANQTRISISAIKTALGGITQRNNKFSSDPKIREYAQKISTHCYRLLRSSISIKELNQFRYGISTIIPQREDLSKQLRDICGVVSPMIEKIGIEFHAIMPDGPMGVWCDSERIFTVLFHLISNAAKFIGENGEITVSLYASEKFAFVTVEDNGLGIPEENVEHVFEEFFSYDPRTHAVCGDGLGLSICKMIIKQHGGTIAITSTEGEGTKFVFKVPLTSDDGLTLRVNSVAADYVYDRESNMFVILSDVCKVPDLEDKLY